MKNTCKSALLLAVTLGFAGTTFGTTFDYKYTFDSSLVVTGSFDGVQNGNFVDSITNISLFFNGTQVPGTLYHTATYTGFGWADGPVVSFDESQNDFGFFNADYAHGALNYDTFFYMTANPNDTSIHQAVWYSFSPSLSIYHGVGIEDHLNGSWSLTAVANGVPDAASTLPLLAAAMLGLITLRQKLRC